MKGKGREIEARWQAMNTVVLPTGKKPVYTVRSPMGFTYSKLPEGAAYGSNSADSIVMAGRIWKI